MLAFILKNYAKISIFKVNMQLQEHMKCKINFSNEDGHALIVYYATVEESM